MFLFTTAVAVIFFSIARLKEKYVQFIRSKCFELKLITPKNISTKNCKKKDNYNQVIKLCGIYGNKRAYSDYHRLYNPCKTCVAKNQVTTIKLMAKKNCKI